jgi:adenylate cyclase
VVVPLMHEGELYGAVWLDSELMARFGPQDLELVTAVANQAALFIANTLLSHKIEHETRTRERLSRLLSPNVAEQVVRGEVDVKQGGMFVPWCTVFNSDIRGFTRMSEGTPPALMIDMLNEYFELMVELVFRHEGTLDKFMGDGLMALWGVPFAHADDPQRAVRCALAMMEALGPFNEARARRGVFPFEIGIGIHAGPLVAGYVGSSRALSYTVIGDTANTSARLCAIAGPGQILVTEPVAAALGGELPVVELAPAQLKGKEQPVRVFAVRR